MRERPILFSAPMVLAILAGTKTQTRRIVTLPAGAEYDGYEPTTGDVLCSGPAEPTGTRRVRNIHGAAGDRLWVRETWTDGYPGTADPILYRATYRGGAAHTWRPSIFMRRAASRISLDVAGVRVEHLQDITEDDARAEGVTPLDAAPSQRIAADEAGRTQSTHPHVLAFAVLWDAINGKRASWASNPLLRVMTFARVVPS